MDTVKTRLQDDEVIVTLDHKFNIPAGKTFYICEEQNGTISLIPKVDDYFATAKENEFINEDEIYNNVWLNNEKA